MYFQSFFTRNDLYRKQESNVSIWYLDLLHSCGMSPNCLRLQSRAPRIQDRAASMRVRSKMRRGWADEGCDRTPWRKTADCSSSQLMAACHFLYRQLHKHFNVVLLVYLKTASIRMGPMQKEPLIFGNLRKYYQNTFFYYYLLKETFCFPNNSVQYFMINTKLVQCDFFRL